MTTEPATRPRSSQDLPGFWEAVREARADQLLRRRGAYHCGVERVCGVPVHPLTLAHCDALLALGNAYLAGGPRTPGAALQVLWVCSPRFVPGSRPWSRFCRNRFVEQVARDGWDGLPLIVEVKRWIDEAWEEFGEGGPVQGMPVASMTVSIVTRLQALGLLLPDREILTMPIRLLAQKYAVLMRSKHPEWRGHDAALAVRREYLRRWHQMGGGK